MLLHWFFPTTMLMVFLTPLILDDDNDGILDSRGGPTGDADNDGIQNQFDLRF